MRGWWFGGAAVEAQGSGKEGIKQLSSATRKIEKERKKEKDHFCLFLSLGPLAVTRDLYARINPSTRSLTFGRGQEREKRKKEEGKTSSCPGSIG